MNQKIVSITLITGQLIDLFDVSPSQLIIFIKDNHAERTLMILFLLSCCFLYGTYRLAKSLNQPGRYQS